MHAVSHVIMAIALIGMHIIIIIITHLYSALRS